MEVEATDGVYMDVDAAEKPTVSTAGIEPKIVVERENC